MYEVEVERFEREGLTAIIRQDEDGEYANPRDNDNLGTMVCWHSRYQLGDEQFEHSATCPRCDGNGYTDDDDGVDVLSDDGAFCPRCKGDGEVSFESLDDVAAYYEETRDAIAVLPLALYDHSGLYIRVGSSFGEDPGGWDTTRVGFIFTTRERVTELCGRPDYCPADWEGTPEAWLETQLRNEVEEYARWLAGEVYWYAVEDEDGETLGSVGGFIGSEYAEQEAKSALDYYADERVEVARRNALCMRVWAD